MGHLHQRQQRNEFLDQWMEQLEETTRQMPYESLLQRVLQLESELMDTQEKLKKANKHLSTSRDGTNNRVHRHHRCIALVLMLTMALLFINRLDLFHRVPSDSSMMSSQISSQ